MKCTKFSVDLTADLHKLSSVGKCLMFVFVAQLGFSLALTVEYHHSMFISFIYGKVG